jgi:RecA/RadA recombinase
MALGFYASVRIQIKKDKELLYEGPKTGHDPIGQIVQFNVVKNKTAVPYKTGSFKFYFTGEIKE